MNNEYLKLCLVTNISSCNFDHYEKFISSAALGGVTSVQLREKNMDYSELKYFALMIQATLKPLIYHLLLMTMLNWQKKSMQMACISDNQTCLL
jgi:thiamine-phosphate pyrophosphorylase